MGSTDKQATMQVATCANVSRGSQLAKDERMSQHKIPLTPIEESGLRAHRLPIGKPSQLSDVFRQGILWAQRTQEQRDAITAQMATIPFPAIDD